MLVLSRKVDEQIQIGDQVTITIVRIAANSVRIGVEAPPNAVIVRDELLRGLAAAQGDVASQGPSSEVAANG